MSIRPQAANPRIVASVCSRLSTLHGPAMMNGFFGLLFLSFIFV